MCDNAFFKDFIYFQSEGKGGEREGEKQQLVVSWDMYPEQESYQRPFTLWYDIQPTDPHQSGQER